MDTPAGRRAVAEAAYRQARINLRSMTAKPTTGRLHSTGERLTPMRTTLRPTLD